MAKSGRLGRVLTLLGLALLLGACSLVEIEDAALTSWKPAGPNAERIDDLFWMVFNIAAGVFAFVVVALIVIVVRFRDRSGAKEPKQLHGNARLEVVWTVIPALILATIAVPTVQSVFDLTGCDPDSMRIQLTGHQWWFEVQYPDYGIDTANVVVIPAGEEACLEMTSDDVLHNFWAPALHGKRYLVPGQFTELRLESYEPGEFWAHCAEYCGLSHSLMRARVLALAPADFQAWVEAQQQPAVLPAEGTQAWEGYQVFVNKGCTQCHSYRVDGEGGNIVPADAFNGPDLTHFASRNVFAGAVLPEYGESREDALRRWLADPPSVKPGSYMPNLALTAEEIDNLIVFLEESR
jgi:cytochrome c oxidase subunit 2